MSHVGTSTVGRGFLPIEAGSTVGNNEIYQACEYQTLRFSPHWHMDGHSTIRPFVLYRFERGKTSFCGD